MPHRHTPALLRRAMKARQGYPKISAYGLAKKVSDSGVLLSPQGVRNWVNGARTVSRNFRGPVAIALGIRADRLATAAEKDARAQARRPAPRKRR